MILHLKLREDGQGLVEYALIITLVAIAAATSVFAFGGGLRPFIQSIADAFP